MAFRDFKEHFREQARKVGFFNKDGGNQRGAMPNGGTTGYYPDNKARDLFATQDVPMDQVRQAEQQYQQTAQTAAPQNDFQQSMRHPVTQPQANDPVGQYTSGFGGFQQNNTGWQNSTAQQQTWQQGATGHQANAQQQTWQQGATGHQANAQQQTWQQGATGYQPNAQQQTWQQGATGYQPNPQQQTWQQGATGRQPNAQQNWQQTGRHQNWQQAMQQQNTAQQTGYQQVWQQQTGYQQNWQHQTGFQPNASQVQTPQQRAMGLGNDAETPRQHRAAKRQQRVQQEQPQPIAYMPNSGTSFVDETGKAFAHVERIVQVVSVAACFRVMEFMRNGESIIVNTESIANEADTQRCLDLLAGAAFTMGSSMTKITQLKRTYLIAPKTVLVMADTTVGNWAERDSAREQLDTEQPENFRAVHGAYVPDRPDEQRRDMYQAQQERAQQGYTAQQRPYAQSYR